MPVQQRIYLRCLTPCIGEGGLYEHEGDWAKPGWPNCSTLLLFVFQPSLFSTRPSESKGPHNARLCVLTPTNACSYSVSATQLDWEGE